VPPTCVSRSTIASHPYEAKWHSVSTGQVARLPWPVFSSYEWQQDGACAQADPSLFFHPDKERGPARRLREVGALAVCAVCVVLDNCRTHALSVREPYGVWGGTTERERETIHLRASRADRTMGDAR
jgi:WhiB family redox-sensing transcriptional regulator